MALAVYMYAFTNHWEISQTGGHNTCEECSFTPTLLNELIANELNLKE